MNYISGTTIKALRQKKSLTQKQLADILSVSDKTVSKWETNKGCPDISIINQLAGALGVSVSELFTGDIRKNQNLSANLCKTCFYICPVCGNIVSATGQCSISCCGILLDEQTAANCDDEHKINLEISDDQYYVTIDHPMTKQHYISFICYLTPYSNEIVKQYPEQNASARFCRKGHGYIFIHCTENGLFKIRV